MAEFIYYNANKCWTSATTEVNRTENLFFKTKIKSQATSFIVVSATDFVAFKSEKKENKTHTSQPEI